MQHGTHFRRRDARSGAYVTHDSESLARANAPESSSPGVRCSSICENLESVAPREDMVHHSSQMGIRQLTSGICAIVVTCALTTCPVLSAPSLQRIGTHNESNLEFQYMQTGAGTRCGSDLFVVEHVHWKCLRRGADGKVTVVEFGRMNAVGTSYALTLRGPTLGDPRILLATARINPRIDALDPMTGLTVTVGSLTGVKLSDPPMLADHDGDGIPALVVFPLQGNARIVRLPPEPGQPLEVVKNLEFTPTFAGQLDADPQSELAVTLTSSTTGFRDSATLAWEPFSITGGVSFAVDWDRDGVDELVTGHMNRTEFVDLNSGAPPAALSHGWISRSREHSVVHWSNDSPDIAFWSMEGLVVVDPVQARVLAEFPGEPGLPTNARAVALPIDWDDDGDGDLLWSGEDESRLYLLRQGAGLSLLQQSVDLALAGYALVDGKPLLATIAREFSTAGTLRRQLRNPKTLKPDFDAPIEVSSNTGLCRVADIHPDPGTETICAEGSASAQLLASDGTTTLWTLAVSDPRFKYRRLTLPDHTCSSHGCRLVLLQELPFLGSPYSQVLRLIDAASGEERWRLQLPGFPEGPQLLTDLDMDGVMDVLYADTPVQPLTRINAIDSETRALRWQRAGQRLASSLVRSSDRALRLAVLETDSTVTLLSPLDGKELASARVLPTGNTNCDSCTIHYLKSNDTFGGWVISNSLPHALNLIDRDLRSPIWRDLDLSYASATTRGDRYLHVLDTDTVYTMALGDDGIFADRLEGW